MKRLREFTKENLDVQELLTTKELSVIVGGICWGGSCTGGSCTFGSCTGGSCTGGSCTLGNGGFQTTVELEYPQMLAKSELAPLLEGEVRHI